MVGGERRRTATFHPLTGRVELEIQEARDAFESYPSLVTHVLSASVASIGPVPFSPQVARAISATDRQVLLLNLAAMMGGEARWLQPKCPWCDHRFDVPITYQDLPIVDAPGDYPVFQGKMGDRTIGLRVVTGVMEEKLAWIEDEKKAVAALIDAVVDWGHGGPPSVLGAKELNEIEAQLEAGSPAIADEIQSRCPYCGKDVVLELDFIDYVFEGGSILEEIHQIALQYHWSEPAIAALPRKRRRRYLKMIQAARGVEA